MPLSPLKFFVAALSVVLLAGFAQDHDHNAAQTPYAGFEARSIKSLSEQDLETLERGGGWGLALPAELNGWPGPLHLLELRDELGLTDDQVTKITAIYEQMRSDAISAGARFITAEAALSDAFGMSDLSQTQLMELLEASSRARADLRFVHLSRHLATPALLSEDQIKTYNILRGYSDDPCSNIPEGHNPEMWRRHNGCD